MSFIHRLISLPLPTLRLATSAMRALEVDKEISPFVRRSFSVVPDVQDGERGPIMAELRTLYEATTNRMLRVAVNGFMESLGVVLGVMEELDVDVIATG